MQNTSPSAVRCRGAFLLAAAAERSFIRPAIPELRFYRQFARGRPAGAAPATTATKPTAMIPLLPKDMMLTTVETVCYFCTAVGILLTFMFSPRR